MTDLRTLLSYAADEIEPAPGTVDADLVRGRRALRRRHAQRTAAPLLLVTAGAAAFAVMQGTDPARPPLHAVLHSPLPVPRITAPAATGIRLVAYTGQQPSGYRVAYVPAGWEVQGANAFAMTIAPKGFADQQPDSFVGKLLVMLQSSDAPATPEGTPRPVGTGTGYLRHTEGIVVLTYQDSAKHWVQLQVPPTLHWSDDDVAAFAAGVEVTKDAVAGRG